MSEWRKVGTTFKTKEKESLINACEKVGLKVSQRGKNILLANHGLKTWANKPLTLFDKGEEYTLGGEEVSETELNKVMIRIKKEYIEIIVMNTMTPLGYFTTSKTKNKDKIKITLSGI